MPAKLKTAPARSRTTQTDPETGKQLKTRDHLATKKQHIAKEPTTIHCNGKLSKQANEYCTKPPGWGTNHPGIGRCKWHGGAAPNYDMKVQKLRAAAAVEEYGLPREIDPHDALLEELARTAGHVDWLRLQIANLQHTDAFDQNGQPIPDPNNKHSKLVTPIGGANGALPEYVANIWIQMYNDERKHLVQVSKTCIQAGIEERKVRLAESQGQVIANVLREVLSQLDVLTDPRTPGVVRSVLEGVTTGPLPALTAPQPQPLENTAPSPAVSGGKQ